MKNDEVISPLLHVPEDDAPTLLLAGGKDELVPIQHSRSTHTPLEKVKVSSRVVEFPSAGHGFRGDETQKATDAMAAWFVTNLAADGAKRRPADQLKGATNR